MTKDTKRFVLSLETQRIEWTPGNEMPEVVPEVAYVLDTFETNNAALDAVANYRVMVGAKAAWSDVRAVEACSCCGSDIQTKDAHEVLVLSLERGSEFNPEVLDCAYAARFCSECAPKKTAGQLPPTEGEMK